MADNKFVAAIFIIGLLLGAIIGVSYSIVKTGPVVSKPTEYEAFFSPDGGCAQAVVHWIGKANRSIHVLIYSFTLNMIAEALISAHERGVQVQIVFETSQISEYSQYTRIKNAGIDIRNDTNSALMHNKVAIVDGSIVLTGSFNWSKSGESSNNENLIVIHDVRVASAYEQEFQNIWNQSI